MRLAATVACLLLTAITACGGEGGTLPESVQVTCHPDGTTSLDTRSIRTQADGVHVRLVNLSDDYARLEGVGGGSAPGASEFVSTVTPGQIEVACSIGDAHTRAKGDGTSLTIRDVAGHWVDPKHHCGPGQGLATSVIDYAAPTSVYKGPEQDPLEVARKGSTLRPGDVTEIVGYPKADSPIVRFIRDGQVTKTVLLTRIRGRLAIGGEERCYEPRRRRPTAQAPPPTPAPHL